MNTASILIVEDDQELMDALVETLELAGYQVLTAMNGHQAMSQLVENSVDLVISDIQMPQMDGQQLLKQIKNQSIDVPVMLMTAYGTIQQAVDAMRDGAVDYLVKPFEAEVLVNMASRYVGQSNDNENGVVAEDESSKELLKVAKRVAESDATVLITGESGTGKEVLARFIHDHSSRKDKPFVAINCAAIPENMLEATLFGYEKGAYTGAYKASPGKFELANGGTLLLDEITEMDLGLQAKLLRVLQEREVERLGGNSMIELDVRVLATSNRDMFDAIEQGTFREDLYYRINVFPVYVKALADRCDDIIPLANLFLEKYSTRASRTIPILTEEAKQRLLAYEWSGNVRELDNVMQRCLILQAGDEISAEDVRFEVGPNKKHLSNKIQENPDESNADSLNKDLRQREWDLILKAIREAQGSRKITAERLGISQRTLRYKLARMREAGVAIPGSSEIKAVS
ncbi:MAG: sigma-54 dependent transcriptional regulator [Gammaproteobacteria bacterium]|nr:sigma-54 dependent transcriptional regulator [Gammaproteobacteria bacterium]MDH5776982.1 sigma-54 dependent transcriptional regulator [Gammaproteobacteria bacterium]